jgi:hypothetical protein
MPVVMCNVVDACSNVVDSALYVSRHSLFDYTHPLSLTTDVFIYYRPSVFTTGAAASKSFKGDTVSGGAICASPPCVSVVCVYFCVCVCAES